MLPSTGYFKGINCPFYDSGLCERPYCHFRHVKKDSIISQNDGIESGAILQKLVSAAVQKVLQQTEISAAASSSQTSVSDTGSAPITNTVVHSVSKATYNPTPISELKKIISLEESEAEEAAADQRKRHIPVPYTPRKPTSIPIKRALETNSSSDCEPLIYLPPPPQYKPGSTEGSPLDPYLPKGSVVSAETYLPGTPKDLQEYAPTQTQLSDKRNYIPSDKNVNRKNILEYSPITASNKHETVCVKYQPTPKSQVPCFSSDDEPEPKKCKLLNDLNGLDDLGAEFDMLGQILDEVNIDENQPVSELQGLSEPTQHLKDLETKDSTKEKQSKISKNENTEAKAKEDRTKEEKVDKKDKTSSHKRNRSNDNKSKGKSEYKSKKKDEIKVEKDDPKHKVSQKDKIIKGIHEDGTKSSPQKSDHCKTSSKNSEKNSDSSKHCRKNSEKHSDSIKHSSKTSEKQSDPSKHSTKTSEKHSDSSKNIEKLSDSGKHSSKISEKHSDTRKDSIKISEKHSDTSKHSSKVSEKHSKSHSRNSTNSKKSKTSSSSRRHNGHSTHKDDNMEKTKHQKHKESNKHSKDKAYNVFDGDENLDDRSEMPDDDHVSSSESDEESRALECKKIFEEYTPTDKSKSSVPESENVTEDVEEPQYIPGKIRISRTNDKNIKVQPKAPMKPDYKVNAAQAMNDRLAKVREYHASRNITPETSIQIVKPELIKSTSTPVNTNSSKVRIAHVPYASTMVNVKKSFPHSARVNTSLPSTSTTIVQTVKKGVQRTAHVPNDKFIDRPGVLEPLASKIPANIRSIYLNMMIDECLKIYIYPTDAYARAQYEELNTSKKCSKVQIYKNSAVLTVTRLRKELQECNGVKKSGSECTALQRVPQAASGNSNTTGSWSIESKSRGNINSSEEFRGAKFYNNIKKWILTEEQLQENGFPRQHPSREKGRAIIFGQNKQKPPKGFIRTCCRCKKEFTVDKKGFPAVQQECIYHPNNKYRYRGEAKYQCCSQDGMSDGCCVAPCHVWEYVDYENLRGYVSTLPPQRHMEDYGVYSLDCEMCYTTHGLDLTRITVIDSNCKVVYETLTKPIHPIIDYNTRYSGITEEQMANVNTTLIEVQATLLTMFNSKTILIGHSLESDFKALKLIHGTVLDTSILFPHKMGPPFKRALRNLSSEYLKKIIQNSVDGHDSAEDATVCMELLIYKLKEALKTR